MRQPKGRSPQTRCFLILIAGLVAWTVLVWGFDNGTFGLSLDDGLYLSAAESLRDGRGYGLPSRPGEPPPKYPIGMPAIVAVAFLGDPRPPTLDHEIAIARALVLLGGWGFFLAAHAWLRRTGVGPGLSCVIILATAFHHVVFSVASTLSSDLPFAAVTYVLLARFKAQSPRSGWVDGLLAGCCCLIRSNGITMIAASLLASAMPHPSRTEPGGQGGQRRLQVCWSRWLGCLVAAVVVVGPATWYAGLHPRVVASNHYLLEMKVGWSSPEAGLEIVAKNVEAMVGKLPMQVVASPLRFFDPTGEGSTRTSPLTWLFRGCLSGVVGLGLVRLARTSTQRDLPAWTHAVGSMAIFAVWPWNWIMDRFLLSLMPMIFLAFASGMAWLFRLVPGITPRRRVINRLVVLAVAVAAVGNAMIVKQILDHFHTHAGQMPGNPDRADLGLILGLIRDQTEPDAVIASAWPELVYLRTRRTSIPIFEDEAMMLKRFGNVDRLKQWIEVTRGRPFYLLHRTPEEDPDGADEAQIAALLEPTRSLQGDRSGPTLKWVAQSPDGHFRVSRLIETTP